MKQEENQTIPDEMDKSKLIELSKAAKKLEDRIRTLERLLDAEAKGWREK